MRKLYIFGLIALATLVVGLALADEMTFTTYYPAPYGVYREFTTTNNTYLATDGGNVGIGTTAPKAKLHVLDGWPQLQLDDNVGSFRLWGGNNLHMIHCSTSDNCDTDDELYSNTLVFVGGQDGRVIIGDIGTRDDFKGANAQLDVRGEVKIGNTSLGCNSNTGGAMRYNSGKMEYCDGTVTSPAWKSIGLNIDYNSCTWRPSGKTTNSDLSAYHPSGSPGNSDLPHYNDSIWYFGECNSGEVMVGFASYEGPYAAWEHHQIHCCKTY